MKMPRRLKGRKGVVLDTMLFIYLFEDHPHYAPVCDFLFNQMTAGIFAGVVTPVTIAEVLLKPIKDRRVDIAERYQATLGTLPNLSPVLIDHELGAMAGALRAKYNLPLPDMFQVAAALHSEKPTLISNDKHLSKVTELDLVLLSEFE